MLVPRRLPLTAWEKNLISRLLTPTCSYLARSKSAGCQSGEEGTLPLDNRKYSFALILLQLNTKGLYWLVRHYYSYIATTTNFSRPFGY